ncbi:MAG: DinB family protein [Candidatus Acidiferrales bacterium]
MQAAAPAKLRRLVKGLSRAQLRRRPAPRKWSISEIALHLTDVEVTFAFRLRKIIAEPGGLIAPMDQERWAEGLRYRDQNLRMALNTFAALRKSNLALFSRLSNKQWRQWARHPEYPRLRYQLEPVFIHLASHDLNHLGQIAALRRRWQGR